MSFAYKKSLSVVTAFLSFLALASGSAVASPSAVKVVLFNSSAVADMPSGLGMAMPNAVMSSATMHVAAFPPFAKAGEVTFNVTNNSTDTIHEMIVVKIADKSRLLPFDKANNKVDEDTAGHLGEVSELDPGKTGSLTLTLGAGTYILFCNLPGHYMAGMWTLVDVK